MLPQYLTQLILVYVQSSFAYKLILVNVQISFAYKTGTSWHLATNNLAENPKMKFSMIQLNLCTECFWGEKLEMIH